MAIGESINNYYGRMEYILQHWGNHGIPKAYLTGIFVGGLYPPESKIAIKEKNPRNVATIVQYANQYEEARIGENQMTVIDPNMYPPHLVYPQPGIQIPNYQQPIYQTLPTKNYPSQTIQPTIVIPPTTAVKNTKTDLLNKLVEEMADLRVQITNAPVKRSKSTSAGTNVWCTNCQGHGHFPSECPTPISNNIQNDNIPRCTFCRGKHFTNKCWHLATVKQDLQAVKQVLQIDSNKPWVNKSNHGNPNKRSFTCPNTGQPYQSNNNRPCWNDTYNAPPVWNN